MADNPGFDPSPESKKHSQLQPQFQNTDNYGATSDVIDTTPPGRTTPSGIPYEKRENRRMFRNVTVISCCFTLLFTAYSSMSNLQSSLHPEQGLGNWSSSTVYASMVFSTLFVPTAFIRKFTIKWTIFISMFGYTTYILAQFYPHFETLIPAAVIVGICAAPLWVAKCTYLTHVGNEYAGLIGDTAEVVIVRFFGIFFMCFQCHAVFGNIISSTILSLDMGGDGNKTVELNDLGLCGANFCPGTNLTELEKVDETKVYILGGIYMVIALCAAGLLAVFVDPLSRYGEKKREGSTLQLAGATIKQMRKPYQILIIPLTIWSGLEQGFLSADYTAAYITCGWGVEKIGYVLICYGLADSISSLAFTPLVRYLGRIFVFFFGATLSVGLIVTLLLWEPNPDQKVVFFVIAALWGVSDAAWQCGINAYYGVLFPDDEEAAFSNYRLWESIGFVIAFAESNLMCVNSKLYVCLGAIILGMMGFVAIEVMERRNKKSSKELS